MKIKQDGKIYEVADDQYRALLLSIRYANEQRRLNTDDRSKNTTHYMIKTTDPSGEEFPLIVSHMFEIVD